MTIVDTRSETELPQTSGPQPSQAQLVVSELTPSTDLAGILSSSHHQVIGRLYVLCALGLSGLGLGLGLLMNLEKVDLDAGLGIFGNTNELFQVFALYRTTLIMCGLVPLLLGLATAVIPKQLRTVTVAYPRAAAAAFWTWLIGAITHIVATFSYGGLGSLQAGAAREQSVELTLLSLGVVALGLLVGSGVILATLITQRPAGMDLLQMPAFSWSMMVATTVWLFSLPVLLANLVISWVDMRGATALRFGTADAPFEHVAWAFDVPQVYAWALPLLGIVAEVLISAHRSRPKLFEPMVFIVGAFGFLSFGAWAQSFFDSAEPSALDAHVASNEVVFVVFALGIAGVVLAFGSWLAFNVVSAEQRPIISPQFGLAVLSGALLTAAVTVGVLRVAGSAVGVLREADSNLWPGFFDAMDDLAGSSLVTGMMNLVVLAGLLAAVAGIFHWAPRLLGRRLNASLGFLAVVMLGGGAMLYGFTDVLGGFFDQPDRFFVVGSFAVANLDAVDALGFVEALNVIGLVGVVAVLGGLALVVLNVVMSLVSPADLDVADDPSVVDDGDGLTADMSVDGQER